VELCDRIERWLPANFLNSQLLSKPGFSGSQAGISCCSSSVLARSSEISNQVWAFLSCGVAFCMCDATAWLSWSRLAIGCSPAFSRS
jgi:hypothetical protein